MGHLILLVLLDGMASAGRCNPREREGTPARVRRSLRPNGRQALYVHQKKCGLRLKTKLAAESTGFVSDKSPAAGGSCKYA